MIYDIGMPRKDFDQIQDLVKGLTTNFQPRELVLITQDDRMLPFPQRRYLAYNPGSLGVTWLDREAGTFDIWLTPNYRVWKNSNVVDTVMHELVHGYTGSMNHSQTFRRHLIKALHTYDATIAPIPADRLARTMVNRYSKDEYKTRNLELEFAKKAALNA